MILAFGHQKQVGKDTAVKAIAEREDRVEIYSLASPLYRICEIMVHDFKPKYFYDDFPYKKNEPFKSIEYTPRQLLIDTGQKLKEIYGKHCWVDLAINFKAQGVDLLISDLRYKEEAERLAEHGAIFIKVVRPDLEHTSDTADDDLLGWSGWDHTLVNDCCKEDFELKALQLFRDLKGERG